MNMVGGFCMAVILTFMFTDIVVQYVQFKYKYREGINNMLTVLIGGESRVAAYRAHPYPS